MPQLDFVMIVVQSHILLFFICGYLIFIHKIAPLIIFTLKYRKLLFLKSIQESYNIKKKYSFLNIFFEIRLLYLVNLAKSFDTYKSLMIQRINYEII